MQEKNKINKNDITTTITTNTYFIFIYLFLDSPQSTPSGLSEDAFTSPETSDLRGRNSTPAPGKYHLMINK